MADLLDTSILVDLVRGDERAERAIFFRTERPYVSHVSAMELLAGARSHREERWIDAILASFRKADIDEAVFRLAGSHMRHYRASHNLDVPDALIAATAEHHGLKLATLNVKHFPMFKRLKAAY